MALKVLTKHYKQENYTNLLFYYFMELYHMAKSLYGV